MSGAGIVIPNTHTPKHTLRSMGQTQSEADGTMPSVMISGRSTRAHCNSNKIKGHIYDIKTIFIR